MTSISVSTLAAAALLIGACTPPVQEPPPTVTEASTEEVSFDSGGLALEGVLHLPARGAEPVGGVVLVHGSGPQNRDEALPLSYPNATPVTVEVFVDLAEALSDAGYAVLRYDKRTCGPFNGACDNSYPTPGEVLVSDFKDDADAALDYLGGRAEVDPNKLAIAGHSQGATFAPLLLQERPELAAGVLMAGPYRGIEELLAWQAELQIGLLVQLGYTQAAAEAQLAPISELAAQLAELRAGTYDGDELSAYDQQFWLDWFELGDQAIAVTPGLDRPLLVQSGALDWNTPPEETEAWAELLAASPGVGHRSDVLPCLTHGLNCVTEPDFLLVTDQHVSSEVSADFIAGMVDFLGIALD